jgi:hypothetical protein
MPITVTRATRRVEFCQNLALKAEHEAAVAGLAAARQHGATDPREAGGPNRATELAHHIRALEDQMRDATLVFTLQAARNKAWIEWEETHPPRAGNKTDEVLIVDASALDDAIAQAIVSVETLDGDPVDFDPATEWTALADEMTNGQWQDFALAVLTVNRGVKAAPFSGAASHQIRKSERTSS